MKISVLIPTRGRPETLHKAIRSALQQTHGDLEIVVTDNSSDSESERVVRSFQSDKITYFRNEENIGPIRNWRKALELATGDYCILLPDDDYFLNPFYLEDAAGIILRESVPLVLCHCVMGGSGQPRIGFTGAVGRVESGDYVRAILAGHWIPTIANVFSRAVALEKQAFLNAGNLYSDIELWLQMLADSPAYLYNVPSVFYFFHDQNVVYNMSQEQFVQASDCVVLGLRGAMPEYIPAMMQRFLYFILDIGVDVSPDLALAIARRHGLSESAMLRMMARVKIKSFFNMARRVLRRILKRG
jgi:glycosyltransferase involved in cell wall biosynthesis